MNEPGQKSQVRTAPASGYGLWIGLAMLWIGFGAVSKLHGETATDLFARGSEAYQAGDYRRAVRAFRDSLQREPAAGTFQNLGNAEWQLGHTGQAILAWEQSLWLDPFHRDAYNNLRFARKTAQLEAPELSWYEVVSSWLTLNWWEWIASLSFWLAIAMVLLPSILRWRKLAWHQALAAIGLAVFLLSVPAHLGVNTRSRIGFVLQKSAPLRLTPTDDTESITRLPAGEPARLERRRGTYLLIRTGHATGWIERDQFGLTSALALPVPQSKPGIAMAPPPGPPLKD